MQLIDLGGSPPSYRAQCTQCDVYTSKYWNPADIGPLEHDGGGDGDQYPYEVPELEGDNPS